MRDPLDLTVLSPGHFVAFPPERVYVRQLSLVSVSVRESIEAPNDQQRRLTIREERAAWK